VGRQSRAVLDLRGFLLRLVGSCSSDDESRGVSVLTVGSLFSGIGGLDLGLERAGMQVRWQCEIDPYCRAVLGHHWPGLRIYEDIHDIDGRAERVDLICGGFPCQPVSLAGKGLAQEDPRWLWPEFARVVGDLRPEYVLVENVPGLVKRGLDLVITGLAEMGYDAEWEIVSAAACGAPHLRERIFVIASHADQGGEHGLAVDAEVARSPEPLADASRERRQQVAGGARRDESPHGRRSQEDHVPSGDGQSDRAGQVPGDVAYADYLGRLGRPRHFTEENWRREFTDGGWWATEPDVGRVAHGVPNRMAQLRALGNAVVPQVAEAVGRMILEVA